MSIAHVIKRYANVLSTLLYPTRVPYCTSFGTKHNRYNVPLPAVSTAPHDGFI